jgi:hypothetical protein
MRVGLLYGLDSSVLGEVGMGIPEVANSADQPVGRRSNGRDGRGDRCRQDERTPPGPQDPSAENHEVG